MLSHIIEPVVHPVELAELRPTQMTLGFRQVQALRAKWAPKTVVDGSDYLGRHTIPVVIGPKKRRWMIDHHHHARALLEDGVEHVLVYVVADLSDLDKQGFLTFMDNRNWLHPFNTEGVRQPYDAIPKRLDQLTDDPYRSLSGAVRKLGGYAKVEVPFSEFLWADFFRHHIKPAQLAKDFEGCVERARAIADTQAASYLPGWAGVDETVPKL